MSFALDWIIVKLRDSPYAYDFFQFHMTRLAGHADSTQEQKKQLKDLGYESHHSSVILPHDTKETASLTDLCNESHLTEVEFISLLREQIPQYKLRADTLTQFRGYVACNDVVSTAHFGGHDVTIDHGAVNVWCNTDGICSLT
ncbi:unnamed protein product [Darwinula stevensoni]|uniref:Uncharacterized protein n=1 Tax=Darwinula stevensoni TaxID=69355 RepID=A0A7R8XA85_9CRUS|nr:unnamed protein product [Darwinula stevensoni]CAG0890401.1 unnamed protein product [Darwinula stevensoni]